jgi:hypothetical protein
MMRSWLLAVSICAIFAATGRAQNQPAMPKSGPPSFAFVHDVDKSQNLIYVRTIEYVPEERTATVSEVVEANGQKIQVPKTVKVTVAVPVMRVTKWDAEKGVAINGAGKKLSRDDLFEQLKAGDTIFLYGGALDQAFLKPLKENVVLLQMQASSGAIPPMNVPEPIPAPKK